MGRRTICAIAVSPYTGRLDFNERDRQNVINALWRNKKFFFYFIGIYNSCSQ